MWSDVEDTLCRVHHPINSRYETDASLAYRSSYIVGLLLRCCKTPAVCTAPCQSRPTTLQDARLIVMIVLALPCAISYSECLQMAGSRTDCAECFRSFSLQITEWLLGGGKVKHRLKVAISSLLFKNAFVSLLGYYMTSYLIARTPAHANLP